MGITRALVWCLLLSVLALTAPATSGSADAGAVAPTVLEGRVVGITDGDTLTLLVDEEQVRVRLAQIDAPESGQPYGRAAKQALSELAFGRDARVEVVDVDRYGRTVGEVVVDGRNVNQQLVREGHAWAYTKYSRSLEIIELENQARAAGRGLWALPLEQRTAPWSWRRAKRDQRSRVTPPPSTDSFACDERRTCGEMRSCAEARFHLEECGLTHLDGDEDGVPCESLCGG